MTDNILLGVTPNRHTLPIIDQAQLIYVLVELKSNPNLAPARMPLNLSLVLDQSGSMADDHKLDHLKEAVHQVIDLLADDDFLSVITFSGDPTTLLPASSVDRIRRQDLKRRVAAIAVLWTGTNIASALAAARQQVMRHIDHRGVNRIVLLTDGQVYLQDGDNARGERECLQEADACGRAGIPLLALGLGADWSEELLAEMAERAHGQADYVAHPQAIKAFFSSATQAMQAVSAQNVVLTLRLVAGVTPRKVWRVVPMITDLGKAPMADRGVSVPLGELERDVGQALLVELTVNPRPAGSYRIAQVEASYDAPQIGVMGGKVRRDVLIEFTSDRAHCQESDARIMNVVEKVTAFKLQTQALQDAQAGDAAGAQRKLANAVTMLLNQGEAELAGQLQAEADRLASGQEVSSEGRKTMRFTSSKTVRLS